eukprot:CAMPEP_0194540820 /NCGR_PEP_ID=MMETSP0253-20130528/81193_1 /TAXON_ID=2966 /ORGANISM="Noctiluca scintillans" /LENGTH=689 /DNA_ID=CAMNT_0039387229 /DNA_START=249 /DNA_END=2318 /DNA_ORIENTATION=+
MAPAWTARAPPALQVPRASLALEVNIEAPTDLDIIEYSAELSSVATTPACYIPDISHNRDSLGSAGGVGTGMLDFFRNNEVRQLLHSRRSNVKSVQINTDDEDFELDDDDTVPPDLCAHWQSFDSQTHSVRQNRCQSGWTRSRTMSFEMEDNTPAWLKRLVIRPGSTVHISWNVARFTLLLFDVIRAPLTVFDWQLNLGIVAFDFAVSVFWTMDLALSFCVGFYRDGLIEMRLRETALSYFKSSFFPDVMIVLVDWTINVALLVTSKQSVDSSIPMPRIARTLRAVRILRNIHLKRVYLELAMAWVSRSLLVQSLARILILLSGIVLVNHYIACGWVLIGKIEDEISDANWLEDNRVHDFDRGDLYIYTTALHWSLTQFTPASMEVHAVNSKERLFTIVTIIFALLIFSSFLSTITTLMQNLRRLRAERQAEEQLLRSYLVENNISAELGTRISRFLKVNHFRKQLRMQEKDLKMLESLPRALKNLLREELHSPVAMRMPFLKRLQSMDPVVAKRLCHNGVHQSTYLVEELIFEVDGEGKHIFFLVTGTAEYLHQKDMVDGDTFMATAAGNSLSNTLLDGAWICDPALWLDWTYQGQLTAKLASDVTILSVTEFLMAMNTSRPSFHYAFTFAKLFHMYLNSGVQWNTDVWYKSPQISRLVRFAEHGDSSVDLSNVADTTKGRASKEFHA